MIHVIFTLDYEIYGNGTGSLRDLVWEPAERLIDVFTSASARFVAFVEVAEFERIEALGTDEAIGAVKDQIKRFHGEGFEVALHLHPQWYGARYEAGRWLLAYDEYNLCTLSRHRISDIVSSALEYLQTATGSPNFVPLSFRAGNWLFQPTRTAAAVLGEKGIKIDSSVFKGGLQHANGLDYRAARRNGYFWPFSTDANVSDPAGEWLEVPIHTEMVPFWRMLTSKRVGMQTAGASAGRDLRHRLGRFRDYMRPRYPLKFDFCRMTYEELTAMTWRLMQQDSVDPLTLRPMVAIGHTKDLTDLETVARYLEFLRARGVAISTFADVYASLVASRDRSDATRSYQGQVTAC